MPPWEKYQKRGGQSGPWEKHRGERQPRHFDFDPANVPSRERSPSRGVAATSSFVEGIPLVGPTLQSGVENVSSVLGSALTGQPREKVREEMGQMTDEAQAEYPVTSMTSGALGGLAGAAPAVMAAPGVFGAGAGPLGAGLLGRAGMGAASGAAVGGGDAGVRGQDIGTGATVGGLLGGAGPLAGDLVGKGVQAVASRVRGPSAGQRAFGRAAQADAIDDVPGRMAGMGDDAMPMDLGPNLQRQAGALAATPGRGQEVVRGAIASRQAGAGDRVTESLNRVVGKPVDSFETAESWIKLRAANAKPAYQEAYEAGDKAVWSPELERLSSSPTVQNAMRGAVNVWRDRAIADGFGAMNPGALVEKGGQLKFLQGKVPVFPNLQFWDYTKRILDDKARAAFKAGQNQKGDTLSTLARSLRGELDGQVPAYNQARQAYAGPSAIIDALEEGQKVFSRNVTPGQLRSQMADMTTGEREAFVQGARAEIANTMGTARNDALKARQMFQTGHNQEKLALMVGDDQARQLLNTLDAETAYTGTRDVVTGSSETAAREAAKKEVAGEAGQPGAFRSALNMRFGDAAAGLGDRMVGGVRSAARGRANEELAQLLTARDPQGATKAIRMVQAAQRRGDISAQRAKEMIQSMAVGGGQQSRPLEITVR